LLVVGIVAKASNGFAGREIDHNFAGTNRHGTVALSEKLPHNLTH